MTRLIPVGVLILSASLLAQGGAQAPGGLSQAQLNARAKRKAFPRLRSIRFPTS